MHSNVILLFLLQLTLEAHVDCTMLDLGIRIGVIPETKIHDEMPSQEHLSDSLEVSRSMFLLLRKCLLAQDTF
jgi:hypothetical protein